MQPVFLNFTPFALEKCMLTSNLTLDRISIFHLVLKLSVEIGPGATIFVKRWSYV